MLVAKQRRNTPIALTSNAVTSRQALLSQPLSCATFAIIQTEWGQCGITWINRESEKTASAFAEGPTQALLAGIMTPGLSASELRTHFQTRHPNCHEVFCNSQQQFHPEVVPDWFNDLANYLKSYYSNALRDAMQPHFAATWAFWKPHLDWSRLTPFQQKVLDVVATIPSGVVLTYGQVAKKIGKPAAARAVGAAIGSNPWPVLVPCHRVVGSNGQLTGFSAPGGVEAKRRMLAMEGDGRFELRD